MATLGPDEVIVPDRQTGGPAAGGEQGVVSANAGPADQTAQAAAMTIGNVLENGEIRSVTRKDPLLSRTAPILLTGF
jgi:hypothetical protein